MRKSLSELTKRAGIHVLGISRFWRTPAYPAGSGPDYLNAAVVLSSTLSPQQLLDELHAIEAGLGRERKEPRWQSRIIDLTFWPMATWCCPTPRPMTPGGGCRPNGRPDPRPRG